jgi:segregation and condensation protein B
MSDDNQELRLLEALLFAANQPLDEESLADRLPPDADVPVLLARLREDYVGRGVNLVRVAGKWALRTASDLAPYLRQHVDIARKLSRAAIETLAIIAYHQPVTRAEIEALRGVGISRGTLDILLEAGWVRPKGRRRTPGRPATWVTTEAFLEHFGLDGLDELPGTDELRAAGLLDTGRVSLTPTAPAPAASPPDEGVATPADDPDEDPVHGDSEDEPSIADDSEESLAAGSGMHDRRSMDVRSSPGHGVVFRDDDH